ncbi:MAG: glycosyltransferase [Chloroflexi bacterium]|nr:glycosyltransferase [Chloroflexota bacterium]
MFVSTVIPTVGRTTLDRAVQSVLDQGLEPDDHEVIVVNDSGMALELASWMQEPRVSLLNTRRRERSVARNVGAATARGAYLHFLDDDDWLAPGALRALKGCLTGGARSNGDAPGWVYGDSQLVDRNDNALIRLHHELAPECLASIMAGEWVPLQSSLLDARIFFRMGGFDPLIPGAEDVDLIRRFALESNASCVPVIVANIEMGRAGSTTDHRASRHNIRASRERVLHSRRAFGRLLTSSRTAYLRGRVVRVYFTSALWNAGRRRLFTAASRGLLGLATSARSLGSLPSRDFWGALIRRYRNDTFRRGFAEAGLPFVPDENDD